MRVFRSIYIFLFFIITTSCTREEQIIADITIENVIYGINDVPVYSSNVEKKKQKTVSTKEVRFRPGIDQHDYEIKMKKIHKFLGDKNKVKITLRFKGREFGHRELGMKLFDRIKEEIKQIAVIEQQPKMLGRQLVMVLNPTN